METVWRDNRRNQTVKRAPPGALLAVAQDWTVEQYAVYDLHMLHVYDEAGQKGFVCTIETDRSSRPPRRMKMHIGTDQATYDKALTMGRMYAAKRTVAARRIIRQMHVEAEYVLERFLRLQARKRNGGTS